MSNPLTIVIPMAGRGSRFSEAGYMDPKPMIPIGDKKMIELVINNLTPKCAHKFVFICQEEHIVNYGLREKLESWAPGCVVVGLNGVTEGAACTVLVAADFIGDGPLMIANSDQYIDLDINEYLSKMSEGVEGLIMTMTAHDAKWSFVATDINGSVTKVVEKQVISSEATVGIYNFANGRAFVEAANEMIAAQDRVNGEFYVAPVYNRLIGKGATIKIFNVGTEGKGMHGLGTPTDLNKFLSTNNLI